MNDEGVVIVSTLEILRELWEDQNLQFQKHIKDRDMWVEGSAYYNRYASRAYEAEEYVNALTQAIVVFEKAREHIIAREYNASETRKATADRDYYPPVSNRERQVREETTYAELLALLFPDSKEDE